MNLNDHLVFLALPSSIDMEVWGDYDEHNGYGGYHQIDFEVDGQEGIIVKKEMEEEFRNLLTKCEEWYNS